MFDRHREQWRPERAGEPIPLPVRRDGRPAMLKAARTAEERRGGTLTAWWNGEGAARIRALRP